MMLVIGLTGSIGMGKSAAAQHFRARGVPVCDADAEVHRLYEGSGVAAVAAAFPNAIRDGKVDRGLLALEVAGHPHRLKQLEAIVHPLVVEAELEFLRQEEKRGTRYAVLEIPLLFETGADKRVDVTVVLSAPPEVQKARVLTRPGMTVEKLEHLLKRQLPDAEKRARADYVVDSGTSLTHMQAQIDNILESLEGRKGRVMDALRHGKEQ
jgi:dephospho-CoA kinase